MSSHPNEPSVDHLDGMTSMWGFLASLMEPLPPHGRVTVHPQAIATAEPRPRVVELVVEIRLPGAVPTEPSEVIVIPELEPETVTARRDHRRAPRHHVRINVPTRERRPRSSTRGRRTLVA